MMRLIYLDPALADIEGIVDIISKDNPSSNYASLLSGGSIGKVKLHRDCEAKSEQYKQLRDGLLRERFASS